MAAKNARLSPREELRQMMVRSNIDELKFLIKGCDPLSLRDAYVLGRIRTTPQEEIEIRNLITVYTNDCQCSKKTPEVEEIHRLIEKYPKLKEIK